LFSRWPKPDSTWLLLPPSLILFAAITAEESWTAGTQKMFPGRSTNAETVLSSRSFCSISFYWIISGFFFRTLLQLNQIFYCSLKDTVRLVKAIFALKLSDLLINAGYKWLAVIIEWKFLKYIFKYFLCLKFELDSYKRHLCSKTCISFSYKDWHDNASSKSINNTN